MGTTSMIISRDYDKSTTPFTQRFARESGGSSRDDSSRTRSGDGGGKSRSHGAGRPAGGNAGNTLKKTTDKTLMKSFLSAVGNAAKEVTTRTAQLKKDARAAVMAAWRARDAQRAKDDDYELVMMAAGAESATCAKVAPREAQVKAASHETNQEFTYQPVDKISALDLAVLNEQTALSANDEN
jgi:hypothetical protein